MDSDARKLLKTIADIDGEPEGAYNFRINGEGAGRRVTDNIVIENKADESGIDIRIQPFTKSEFVHIPVMITKPGLADKVYNDFYIGENADVQIVAGCGIHNTGDHLSQHDGIHTFHVGKNARVRYVEKHYGSGELTAKKVLNPETVVYLDEGAYLEMETVQIEGVDTTKRVTKANIGQGATLKIKEVIMTSGEQTAYTEFNVDLNGADSHADVVSRSVAKDKSVQEFYSVLNGNNDCSAHSACDAIIMDKACVKAIPVVTANHADAQLIHEAAIGKIAGEQLVKLMTMGLTEEEAEREIVNGFLK